MFKIDKQVVMAGDFNASCLELDNGRWNLYKSRELRHFVEHNHPKHILDVDKAPMLIYIYWF